MLRLAASEQTLGPAHGAGFRTFVCEHLASNPAQRWFSGAPNDADKWPDAWCSECDIFFQQEGEWNDRNQPKTRIKLVCHYCYETLRSQRSE